MASDPHEAFAIRPASTADASAIQSLIAALAKETIGPDKNVLSVDAILRYGFGEDKCFECRVAEERGAVVAVLVLLDEFSTWRGVKGVYVLDIYIAPAARGRGLGKRLIAEAARWAGSRGARYLRLSVDQENVDAIKFYETIGFKEGAHDRVFVLEGEALQAVGSMERKA